MRSNKLLFRALVGAYHREAPLLTYKPVTLLWQSDIHDIWDFSRYILMRQNLIGLDSTVQLFS